ncbi:carbohydrate ABC transporter permease [Roseomonas sp. CAU 1739]|uniref:carbohydrate ABC transporter permease n=1 Tax=Roseomonas sp. CAU 1739 TaxID=3140364 RepID=UPI00325A78DD
MAGGIVSRPLVRERRILSIVAVVLAGMALAPFLWLLQMSFKTNAQIFTFPPPLIFAPTFENYASLWKTGFRQSYVNSLVVSAAATVLPMLIGVPAAYALSRWQARAVSTVSLWILASRMAPPIAFTIPYFLAYRHLELIDTWSGLVLIYLTFNLSLAIWMMRPFFDQLPRSLEEAAWIDGATMGQAFLRIVLPLSAPGLAATAILCFLFAWNDFFFALILTRTEAMTAPVAVVNFMNYEGWEWGRIAAGGTMVMLPVLVFSLLVRKYLVHGLTGGAVKG